MEPRSYQLQLADYLMQNNGILYLPTGSGKTFISILVLKRMAHQLLKPIEEGGKRSVFICNTVVLAQQQCVEIRKATNLKVGIYTGDRNVDSWNRNKWKEEINDHQVLVGTAQIFVDVVEQGQLNITDLNLVVIDECHHAVRNHPMHSFLALMQYIPINQQPRVIGLTGVLLMGSKFSNIEKHLNNLESIFGGRIVTINSGEHFNNVLLHSTKPKESLVLYPTSNYHRAVSEKIKCIVEQCLRVVDYFEIGIEHAKYSKNLETVQSPNKKKYIKNILQDFLHQMNDFGLYTASLAIMSPIIEFEIKKRQATTLSVKNLFRHAIKCCEHIRHVIMTNMKLMVDVDEDYDDNESDNGNNKKNSIYPKIIEDSACKQMDIILNFSSSKMKSLLNYMKNTFAGKRAEDISCLIFVQRRYSAKCIYYTLLDFLQNTPELKDIIFPQFMVGINSIQPSIESILNTKWSKQAIKQFHQGDCNLIVCSQVLEEGIDVQACNYVFIFDNLGTFNSYVQSKGRARSKNSNYVIFANENCANDMCLLIKSFNNIHQEINEYLKSRVLNCNHVVVDDSGELFKDIIPSVEFKSGARLTSVSALKLLHRYCQSLPHDAFGAVMPWFTKQPINENGKYTVTLNLPLQSTVRETIQSDPMETVRDAKISAAFKACLLLYENNELNERLLPITQQECLSKVAVDLFKHWKKYQKIVTTKRSTATGYRTIENKCPDELYNAMPVVGQQCNAYPIEFCTDFLKNDYNAHIIDYLNTKSTFAILVRRTLPHLAEMTLFMTQGKVQVKISPKPIKCMFTNAEEIEKLQCFHTMLFRDLLNIWKSFFCMDRRNCENSYLIVPLNDYWSIDWQLVEQFQSLKPLRTYTESERLNFKYLPEDYLGKVITKWYNKNENERYIVTKIRYDLNPNSCFCGDQKNTYADFFATRYGVNTINREQFLVEVKTITRRRNFFINALGKSREIRKDTNEIILIPELCHNYQFPAEMWLKAIFLPTILHRIYFMLHAEYIRVSINNFLMGKEMFLKPYQPLPLIVDTSLKRAYDNDENLLTDNEVKRKKYLPTLTSDTDKKVSVSRIDCKEVCVPWKEYLEPININNNIGQIYPIEVDYYHHFLNGLVKEIQNLTIANNFWTQSQLDMPNLQNTINNELPKPSRNDLLLSTFVRMIKEPSKEDELHLDILERSTMKRHELKSAEQYEFLAAITTAKVGDVFDMERFELLGDAFLKFACSLYLANRYPTWNEGYLSNVKGCLVSNRNLLYCMLDMDLSRRICGTAFTPNICWVPPCASLPSNLLKFIETKNNSIECLTLLNLYSLNLNEEEIKSGECHKIKINEIIDSKIFKSKEDKIFDQLQSESDQNGMSIFLNRQTLQEKVISDTLEAILGVCVKNYGIQETFQLLEYFGIVKPNSESILRNLLDLSFVDMRLRTTQVNTAEIDRFLVNHEYLERNLGYKFRNRAFLLQATTHPSHPTNRLTGCYQELEFIGDAILDMLITAYIFERFQNKTPGKITDLRMALVNNITLACCCVRHRFHLFLLYENSALAEMIKSFADFQETQNHSITNNVRILMEETDVYSIESDDDSGEIQCNVNSMDDKINSNETNVTYNIADNVEVPKVLGDLVEALIAAVYIDSRDLKTTWGVIYNLLEKEIKEFQIYIPVDPVRELMETQGVNAEFSSPVSNDGLSMVMCTFDCLDERKRVHAFGNNSKQAKKAAAKAALKILAKKCK